MSEAALIAAISLGSYLVGSVSFGLWMASRRGVDLRAFGSGNTGATNVGRALGKKAGRTVLLLDALKGFAPVLTTTLLYAGDARPVATQLVGIATVVGHIFPIWHRFRGGKGAATGLGALLAAAPIAGGVAALTFVVARKLSGYTSVGSLAGTVFGCATVFVFDRSNVVLAASILLLVSFAHRSNIRRLWNGTEPKAS